MSSSGKPRNVRLGISNDAEKLVANVSDVRDVSEIGLRQDWLWRAADDHLVQWGFHVSNSEAAYDYDAAADYFGRPMAVLPGTSR